MLEDGALRDGEMRRKLRDPGLPVEFDDCFEHPDRCPGRTNPVVRHGLTYAAVSHKAVRLPPFASGKRRRRRPIPEIRRLTPLCPNSGGFDDSADETILDSRFA